tara:strand:- start:47 stop:610 length:564 start_codon:yes stop_codon:yes gene_type:complete
MPKTVTTDDIIEAVTSLMQEVPAPDDEGVFDDDELEEWDGRMESVFSNMRDSAHTYRMLADRLAVEANFVRSQEHLLASRRKGLENKRAFAVSRLKALLEAQEKLTGDARVETVDKSWVNIRRSSREVVLVADGAELKLPEHFVRETITANKTALMNCHKDTPELLPDGVTVEKQHSEVVMWPGKVK